MTDDELADIARQIESLSNAETAKSRLAQTNAGFLLLQANRDACLRVAAASLRAAVWTAPTEVDFDSPAELEEMQERCLDRLLEFQQIEKNKRDFTLRIIQRVEFKPGSDSLVSDRTSTLGDRIATAGCAGVFIILLFLTVSGLIYWFNVIKGY